MDLTVSSRILFNSDSAVLRAVEISLTYRVLAVSNFALTLTSSAVALSRAVATSCADAKRAFSTSCAAFCCASLTFNAIFSISDLLALWHLEHFWQLLLGIFEFRHLPVCELRGLHLRSVVFSGCLVL